MSSSSGVVFAVTLGGPRGGGGLRRYVTEDPYTPHPPRRLWTGPDSLRVMLRSKRKRISCRTRVQDCSHSSDRVWMSMRNIEQGSCLVIFISLFV
jgi:hypothetical protein